MLHISVLLTFCFDDKGNSPCASVCTNTLTCYRQDNLIKSAEWRLGHLMSLFLGDLLPFGHFRVFGSTLYDGQQRYQIQFLEILDYSQIWSLRIDTWFMAVPWWLNYSWMLTFIHVQKMLHKMVPLVRISIVLSCRCFSCIPFSNIYYLDLFVYLLFLAVGHPGHALDCEPSNGCWWGNCSQANDVYCPNIWPSTNWWKRGSLLLASY